MLMAMLITSIMSPVTIFDFNKGSDLSGWNIVNDVVMGGRSSGTFELNHEGNGLFTGSVSLENNGGFSSVRYRFSSNYIDDYKKFVIRLKGDNKTFQFRVKTNSNDYYSYIFYIATSDEWQTIEIPFNEMYPSFRGMKLNQPNYPGESIGEIGFLFGNKKAEDFRLEIDKIEMK